MKQLLQYMRDGRTEVADVPVPSVRPGMALVRTAASLVSAGTERMVVEFAEKNLLAKAQSRPDLVRQVLDKARREGILPTIQAAFNRLDQPMALGYSSAGTIVAIGPGMKGFKEGDRVACAGGGFASHAEYAVVPANLLAKLPDSVDFESASFATLAAIALHGFRLAQPQVGERIGVIGLGLLGLLTVGIAQAAGCQVFGVDLSSARVELAQQYGAYAVLRSGAEAAGQAWSNGFGCDAVLICADSRSSDPVQLAAALARDRATVVSVGAVGLSIQRKPFYEKELTFLVSRSYGPGRYDPAYEEGGRDYPPGYVRWTEGRNLNAVVDMMASGKLDVHPLITHRIPIDRGAESYEIITGKTKQPFLGVLLTYPQTGEPQLAQKVAVPASAQVEPLTGQPALGVLGAGNYASAVFLPIIRSTGRVVPVAIASGSGLTAKHAAQRFGYSYACSSDQQVLEDPQINTLVILTRHQHHARQVCSGLRLGKHIFCEKPLALHEEELAEIAEILANPTSPLLMVGFNRRFAPFILQLRQFLQPRAEPLVASYRVNAGYIPPTHWVHDPVQGGGRLIGEACHFIDLLSFLVGQNPVSVSGQALPDGNRYSQDNVVLTLTYPDGSLGTVTYLANGDKSFPKERLEVFCAGKVAVLDDFRKLELVMDGNRKLLRAYLSQDKGHKAGWAAFLDAVQSTGTPPIPYDQLFAVTRASFAAVEALKTGQVIAL